MASRLENGFCCIKHCGGVYKQNNIVNGARVDDWTAKLAITVINDCGEIKVTMTHLPRESFGSKQRLSYRFDFLVYRTATSRTL